MAGIKSTLRRSIELPARVRERIETERGRIEEAGAICTLARIALQDGAFDGEAAGVARHALRAVERMLGHAHSNLEPDPRAPLLTQEVAHV